MNTRAEKIKATIITKYGSYEAYLEQRYRTPKAIADQKRAASLGGKKSGNRPFKDPVKASTAGKSSWENRREKS